MHEGLPEISVSDTLIRFLVLVSELNLPGFFAARALQVRRGRLICSRDSS